jgi:hypothetical protein
MEGEPRRWGCVAGNQKFAGTVRELMTELVWMTTETVFVAAKISA